MKNKQKGFGLLEIIILIAITTLLTTIVITSIKPRTPDTRTLQERKEDLWTESVQHNIFHPEVCNTIIDNPNF